MTSKVVSTKLVSIIVCAFNAQKYIQKFSENLAQTEGIDQVVEIIAIDDGSSDETYEALKRSLGWLPNLKVIRLPENLGVASARNFALAQVSAEYVWFVDIDDGWLPKFLSVMSEVAGRHKADIVVCRANRVTLASGSSVPLDGLSRHAVLDRCQAVRQTLQGNIKGYLWNKLFRRSTLGADPFPIVPSQSDFSGYIKALGRATRIVCISELMYFHYTQTASITTRPDIDLGGLRVGLKSMEALLAENDEWQLDSEYQYFAVWFCIIPLAYTPIRLGMAEERQDHYARMAKSIAHDFRLLRVVRFSMSTSIRLALLKFSALTFRLVHQQALRLRSK